MKLYLMRHGDYSADDIRHQNPLSEKGRDDITKLAIFLKPFNIHVGTLVHSEKLRANETAHLMATSIISKSPIEEWKGLNPHDDVVTFANNLEEHDDDLFVVGHLPFMNRLIGQLVLRDENKECVAFQTGTLVCLEKIDPGRWIIEWIVNPTFISQLLLHP